MKEASMCVVGMFGADAVLFALKNFNEIFTQALLAQKEVTNERG
jgi:hypothetical protein